uniref:Slc35a-2 n=1 Tax=Schmidtea mediterranea TaxID=79327 RepID=A0A0H3YKF1_SCHMD|nr:slc35a-2 [Schmidtea mediterranea]
MTSDATDKECDIEENISKEKELINPVLWKFLLFIGVIIYSSYTIFVHLCEIDGKIPFKSSSMVLMTEITKFVMSAIMFIPEYKKHGLQLPPFLLIIPFAVPGFLYCLNNNLAVYIQLEMDPATYQVLGNFKILTTAILFRLIIKKPITKIQWIALGFLLLAGITNSYGGFINKLVVKDLGHIYITIAGLIMISIYCTVSGLSGVYTEYVLKNQKELSIHLQNGLLYSFGILLNGILFLYQGYDTADYAMFTGYTVYTWLLIISQAVIGIIMGVIMKHASNITRLFLISTAMILTTVLSIVIFGLHLNIYFVFAIVLVLAALYLHHM